FVVDLLSFVQDGTIPAGQFEPHQITESLRRRTTAPVPFRHARSVRVANALPDFQYNVIVQTTDSQTAAWAETDMATMPPKLDGNDSPGPVSFGVAASQKVDGSGEGARFVVIGDSDFASNFFASYGYDLFLNCVNWLTIQEDLISIPPKDAADRRLRPTSTPGEAVALVFVTMLLMPLVFTGIGVGVWLKRR
ncbi:MAG: hypothetical protein O3A46_04335, partial [Candidatus Poribacteria bacterium]|nr:hypothetical protein [Candidatus Poribacteria bacterium]